MRAVMDAIINVLISFDFAKYKTISDTNHSIIEHVHLIYVLNYETQFLTKFVSEDECAFRLVNDWRDEIAKFWNHIKSKTENSVQPLG